MKEVPFVNGKYTKGVSFLPKMVYKSKGSDLGPEPPRMKYSLVSPPWGGTYYDTLPFINEKKKLQTNTRAHLYTI